MPKSFESPLRRRGVIGAAPTTFMPIVQAKLRIGKPNDKYEQEANRVANEVMHMPDPMRTADTAADSGPGIQTKCSECTEDRLCPKCAEEEQCGDGRPPLIGLQNLRMKPLISAPRSLQRNGFGDVRIAEGDLADETGPSPAAQEMSPLDCSTHIGDVFKLLATMTSKRPECSCALIEDLRATNLLPETYRADHYLGDLPECPFPSVADFDHWLGDNWNILEIEDRRVVVVNQCGDEEYLEMADGAPQAPITLPQEMVTEPENPPRIDPSADPTKEFGPEVAKNWDAEIWGEKGLAIKYADGTIQHFPEGGTGAVTYRLRPNSIGAYDKYDEDGNKVGEGAIIFTLDPEEIFGEAAK